MAVDLTQEEIDLLREAMDRFDWDYGPYSEGDPMFDLLRRVREASSEPDRPGWWDGGRVWS